MRRRRPASAGLSLFPFLDVLCCTMGSLIMLLCVLAKAAKGDIPRPKEPQRDYAPVRRALEAQLKHVRREREDIQSTLAETRQQLSHVEDHARALREEILQLEEALATLARTPAPASDRAARKAALDARLAELQAKLAESQAQAANLERNYAIIPYEGDNATYRRPVYIECTAEAVILQPEGIVLKESDFSGQLGPGNPLAAALRASHEYLSFDAADAATIGEPYPLLLVRPEGIGAYYAARAALKSWGAEFGYELIDADWPLAFPPADERLAAVQREAVETARQRREFLARSAPKAYGRGSGDAFHNFAGGGTPSGYGGVGRGDGTGDGAAGSAALTGPGGTGEEGPNSEGRGGLAEHPPGSSEGLFDGGATGPRPSTTHRGEGHDGTGGDSPLEGSTQRGPSIARGGRGSGTANSPGGSSTAAGASGKSGGSAAGGQSSQAAGAGAPHVSASKSMAEARGRDWALPKAGPRQIAVSRPIRIICSSTQFTIPAESPSRPPKIIPLEARTEDAIDDLISALWEHQETWGIAGNGMYWKPILKVEVAPDAVARAADLRVLLADSGLTLETAQVPAVVQTPSPPGTMPAR